MPGKESNPAWQGGIRRFRKQFFIATEGTKTEPEYFRVLRQAHPAASLRYWGCGGSPAEVLALLKREISARGMDDTDEAWLVVDKNHWTDAQLRPLHVWAQSDPRYGLALSNPKFEYWLLLHFEDGNKIASASDCDRRLRKHLPNYRRAINPGDFTDEQIRQAVSRAKQRDQPPCKDWPRTPGSTTVYRLVERILNA